MHLSGLRTESARFSGLAHPQLAALDPQKDAKRYTDLLRQAQSVIVPLMPIIPISMTGTSTAMTRQLDTRGLLAHQGSFVRFSELRLEG